MYLHPMPLSWILQTNLIKQEIVDAITAALRADSIPWQEVKSVPFSDELPEMTLEADHFYVVYGSTTLILNAARHPRLKRGVFLDPDQFTAENYLQRWGDRMLNADSRILSLEDFATEQHNSASEWFLRPNEDDKSFSGTVMTFEAVQQLAKNLRDSNNPTLHPQTLVCVSSPKVIEKEWRHFIVDGKVVDTSGYMLNGALAVSAEDVPEALITFVEESCLVYAPHAVFVMDTALSNGAFRIIECNCFNGTGFYDHAIGKIVRAVNGFLLNRQ
jgi:hypothetical protein